MLCEAEDWVDAGSVRTYLELRRLLASVAGSAGPSENGMRFGNVIHSEQHRDRLLFEKRFAYYYGLNSPGLTDEFRRRYFRLLWAFRMPAGGDPYAELLQDLYQIRRSNGGRALPCSFVAKLVAIHDESRPLYDRYVSGFFGMSAPAMGSVEFRIAGFVENLERIRHVYGAWAADQPLAAAIASLRRRIPDLRQCHHVRICDFLVRTAARRWIEIEGTPSESQ